MAIIFKKAGPVAAPRPTDSTLAINCTAHAKAPNAEVIAGPSKRKPPDNIEQRCVGARKAADYCGLSCWVPRGCC